MDDYRTEYLSAQHERYYSTKNDRAFDLPLRRVRKTTRRFGTTNYSKKRRRSGVGSVSPSPPTTGWSNPDLLCPIILDNPATKCHYIEYDLFNSARTLCDKRNVNITRNRHRWGAPARLFFRQTLSFLIGWYILKWLLFYASKKCRNISCLSFGGHAWRFSDCAEICVIVVEWAYVPPSALLLEGWKGHSKFSAISHNLT